MGRLHMGKCLGGGGLEKFDISGSTDQVSKVSPWTPANLPCGQSCSQWSTRVKYSLDREDLYNTVLKDCKATLLHLAGSWRR